MSQSTAKKRAKERDDYQCRFCGITQEQHKGEYGRGLHAHHIIKDADGGADHPRNLITVCRTCHTTLENTQADALSRIKDGQTTAEKLYERRIEALEGDLLEQWNADSDPSKIFTWLENPTVTVHILLDGGMYPDMSVYEDREKAAEAYKDSDKSAKLITKKVDVSEKVMGNLRFVGDAEFGVGRNASSFDVESPETVEGEYYHSDIERVIGDE